MTDDLVRLRSALRLCEPLPIPTAARDQARDRLDTLIAAQLRPRRLPFGRKTILALTLLVAILIGALAISWTAVGPFDLHLFSSSEGPPVSDTARQAFALERSSPTGAIDLKTIEPAGTFALSRGPVTVYVARTKTGVGWATVYETEGRFLITGCSTRLSASFLPFATSGCAPRDTFPGVREISGVAEPPVETVTLSFEDGGKLLLPIHHGVFVYIQGGDTCQRGHRPAVLVARATDGREIGRDEGPFDC